MSMRRTWRKWLLGLLGGVIGGVSSTVLGAVGIGIVGQMGATVTPLNLNELGSLLVSAIIVNTCLYLKKSPLPEDEDEDTTFTPRDFPPSDKQGG